MEDIPKEKTSKPQSRKEKKESVIQVLRERQAKMKSQEKEKPDQEKNRKKRDIDFKSVFAYNISDKNTD